MRNYTDNFTPKDYLDISLEIETAIKNNSPINISGKDSAWLRIIISRSYYSAFLTLKYTFLNNPKFAVVITDTPTDHKIIAEKLNTLPPTLRYLAMYFKNLRRDRNRSDYHLPPTFVVNPILAEQSNKKSLQIINNIQHIVSNLP